MKIFLDTANVAAIRKWARTGLINGVTTNPTHLSKEGGDPVAHVKEICKILPKGDISVEVTEKEPESIYKQALAIAKLSDNVVVKVPCHHAYYEIIHRLVKDGIKLNITLVFSLVQGLLMSKLGVLYISPFIGRLNDIDADGIEVLSELCTMVEIYNYNTQVLAASIRGVPDLDGAIMVGAHAATVPIAVFEKAINHVLTDQGIEKFDADWQKLGIKQFP